MLVPGYALPVVAAAGDDNDGLPGEMDRLVTRWTASYGPGATFNLIATARGKSEVLVFLCPRDRSRSRVAGFSGHIGGLEVLGELVLSTREAKERLERGDIDTAYVEWLLGSVQPASFVEFFAA